MSVDRATAEITLSALKMNPKAASDIWDGFKEILTKQTAGPSQEAREFFEKNQGKQVHIQGTRYIGVIHDLNTSRSGFYPGDRYPLYVKIISSEDPKFKKVVGEVFEYPLEMISIVE